MRLKFVRPPCTPIMPAEQPSESPANDAVVAEEKRF